MKKLFIFIFLLGSFLLLSSQVKAESFYDSDYLSGEYITKVKNNKTYYMTVQFIKDSKGRIVYCLEPFVDFSKGQSYKEYIGDLSEYEELSNVQKRKIELLIYYGYGYGDRTENKWYAITQYLIWNIVDSEAEIFFTKTLNGVKENKYRAEIALLEADVKRHEKGIDFPLEYTVNYKEDLTINQLNADYEIVKSDFQYTKDDNGVKVKQIAKEGKIVFKKLSNYYDGNVVIFDSSTSQDLIRPGNVDNVEYIVDVKVKKGDITLDIQDDASVYTVESDFSNTCYEIMQDDTIIENICTSKEPLVYKTLDLPFGEYTIRQKSVGLGYKRDEKHYIVHVNETNAHPTITLKNVLIKNTIAIMKYACKNKVCAFEKDATFVIKDKNGNVVNTVVTSDLGTAKLLVGYGTYQVSQVKGIEHYTFISPYKEVVHDEETMHQRELFNYFIEEEEIEPDNKDENKEEEKSEKIALLDEEVVEDSFLPPKTGVEESIFDVLFSLLHMIIKAFSLLFILF